jgi:hypothetical protein
MTNAEVAEPRLVQETAPLPRQRGGQPGNQNARKHGFYSSALSPEQQESLEDAAALKDLQSEIALMRVKLSDLTGNPNTSDELFVKAVNLVGRLIAVQHKITTH